jgi:hypothetical protein
MAKSRMSLILLNSFILSAIYFQVSGCRFQVAGFRFQV